jgi:hypothetical protein
MRTLISAAMVVAVAAASGCSEARSEDPGPTVSRNYQIGNFHEVDVGGPFDVDIRTGAKPSVSARGNQALIDRLVVEVKGDKLEIHPRQDHRWFGGWRGMRGHGAVSITVPSLRAATLAGAGDMTIDKVQGERFEGQMAGSGDMRVGSVDVGELKLGIAGSGSAKAGNGKARSAEYEIAGSGGVDAGSVATEELKVSIAGSGSVKAHATRAADVDIMGSGAVDITGGAKCSVSKAGSGDVRCS